LPLNYKFEDETLLQRALTHRSKSADNYERLEFLGDSVLNFTISAELYCRYPNVAEGELTRLRANLVKKDTLALLAREIDLGDFLSLGGGELKSGGFDRDSILGDALEAVFGAVFLDGGIEKARALIVDVYHGLLEKVTPETLQKDPKTQLQEYLQKQSFATPVYNVIDISGQAHDQSFRVECIVSGLSEPVQGTGRSRRNAEQDAAAMALKLLVSRTSA
jgi:ribonuclease-3